MKLPSVFTKQVLVYLLKFFLFFCIAYFGTLIWIGFTVPGNYYSAFMRDHLDYISWMRASLLHGSAYLLKLFGYHTAIPNANTLKFVGGRAIFLVYSCIGYGIMSFWLAFILANNGGWLRKLIWIIGGWIVIWLINIIRMSLLLVCLNKNRQMPFNLDNHTFFNICAYIAIFVMIFFYDRSLKKKAVISGQ